MTQHYRLCGLNNRIIFLTVLEAESSRYQPMWYLMESTFYSVSSCLQYVLTCRRGRASLWGLFVKGTSHSWGFHPHDQISSVQSLSHVWLFATPWTTACQASLSIINFRSLPKLMSIELVMPSNHLILCHPLLLPPSIFPNIRVFSNESALCIRWPKHWSFSFNISPTNQHPGLISFRIDWLVLHVVQGLSRVFSNTTVQKHQFFCAQLSSQPNSHIYTWLLEKPQP